MDGPKAYLEAREEPSGYAAALNKLGRFLADRGRLSGAVRAHRAALSVDPDSDETLRDLGIVLIAAGDIETGQSLLDRVGDDVDTSAGLADAHLRADNLVAGEHGLRHLVDLEPGSPLRHMTLASIVAAQGRIPEAVGLMRTAVRLDDANAPAWAELGALLLLQDDLGSAEEALRTAVALKPGDGDARRHLAMALGRRGMMEDALAQLDTLLAQHPDHAEARVDRGVLLLVIGAPHRAAGDFAKALAVDPGSDRARFYRAIAAIQLGHVGEGKRLLREVADDSVLFAARAAECLRRLNGGRTDAGP